MSLPQSWVDDASAWLRTPQLSVADQIARARDQIRQQRLAEEQERRAAQLSRSQVAPASLMGPPQVMTNSLSQQTTSAQKRKHPERNSYSSPYENTYQAQRQRVDIQGAFVTTSSQAPPMAAHSPQNIHMPGGQVSAFHQRGQSRDTIPTPRTFPTSNQNATPHMLHSHGQLPRMNGPQVSQRPPMSSPFASSPFTPIAPAPASASAPVPVPVPSSSPRPSNTQGQGSLLAEASIARPSVQLGSLSNPHTSSVTIKQEAPQPSTDHVSTSTQPPRSQTSPECSLTEVPSGNVENRRSTTTEAGSRGSTFGPVEGASNPRSHTSPDTNITEQVEPVTTNARDSHSAGEGEDSNQASPAETTSSPNLGEGSTISPRDAREDASQAHAPIETTVPTDSARERTKTPHVHDHRETSTSEVATKRNDRHVVTDAARSPVTSSTTARASPASIQPESPLMVPLSGRQSNEPTAANDPVSPHHHDSGSRDHTKPGPHSPQQSPSTATKDLSGRDLAAVRQVDTAGSPASSSSLSSPISLSAFSPRQSPVVVRTSHQKPRSPVVPPKSPEAPHVESESPRPSVESSRPRQDSAPAHVSHASKSAVVEPSDGNTRRTNSPVDHRRPSAMSATSPVGTDVGEARESHSPKQAPVNVWTDRRRQSQPTASRVSKTPAAESGSSISQPMADHRHRRLSKIWPQADLSKYEGLGEDLVYLAGKRIPEDVVQAHLNAEALYRMEKRTRNQGNNLSGDPHPTQKDCTQAKERYEKWQDQNPGVASKQFLPPDQDKLLKLMRKFGVEVSKNGFLDYHGEQTQAPNATDQDSLAPRRKLSWPDWYKKIKPQQLQTRGKRGGGNIGVDAKLGKFRALVRKCAETQEKDRGLLFDDIRKELHQLVFLEVNETAVRRAQMLHEETGLPQIFAVEFSKGVDYPWDLKADAFELYNRWCTRTFSVDLLRGIVRSTQNNRATDRIEPGFTGKSGAAYHGQGDLVNGQWWPTQLCTVRDGAHGSTQGGIYAVKGKPAFSIIVSGGSQYNDRDEGTELWYSGTYNSLHSSSDAGGGSSSSKYSDNTQSLILSVEQKKPVRVIRSHNMKRDERFRPLRGFRYDGLYDVVGYEVANEAQGGCLFHMVRCPGQDPIRSEGISMRPTGKEIVEYDKIKKLL